MEHYLEHASESDDRFPELTISRYGTAGSLVDFGPSGDGRYRLRFSLTGVSMQLRSSNTHEAAPEPKPRGAKPDFAKYAVEPIYGRQTEWKMDLRPIQERSLRLTASCRTTTIELCGNREGLVGLCLDVWAQAIDDASFDQCWDQILRRITNAPSQSYQGWVAWHQSQSASGAKVIANQGPIPKSRD